ncbi:MAG: VOC family protein [Oscillospiraceae bacterium]
MIRSMMQTYVRQADEAIALYQAAFGAKLLNIARSPDGKVIHSELDIEGQVLAVCDVEEVSLTGNTMQFCLHYAKDQSEIVRTAYGELKEGGEVLYPLGECMFSPLMADVIDRFGVRWCIFTEGE